MALLKARGRVRPHHELRPGMQQAGGALMGIVLAPLMVLPSMAATMSRENHKANQRRSRSWTPTTKPAWKIWIGRSAVSKRLLPFRSPTTGLGKVASDARAAKIELQLAESELAGRKASPANVQAQGQMPPRRSWRPECGHHRPHRSLATLAGGQRLSGTDGARSHPIRCLPFSQAIGAYAEASNEMSNIMGARSRLPIHPKHDPGRAVASRRSGRWIRSRDLLTAERSAIAGLKPVKTPYRVHCGRIGNPHGCWLPSAGTIPT